MNSVDANIKQIESSIFIYTSSDKLLTHEYDKLKDIIKKNGLINDNLQKCELLINDIENDIIERIAKKKHELNILITNNIELQKTFDNIVLNLQH